MDLAIFLQDMYIVIAFIAPKSAKTTKEKLGKQKGTYLGASLSKK